MAGWNKMPLGREIGLDPSNNVLDGDPPPLPKKWAKPPIFGRLCQDATWYKGRPWTRPHCVTWDPAPPPKKKAAHPWPMSIVAKRSPISATAEHLYFVYSSSPVSHYDLCPLYIDLQSKFCFYLFVINRLIVSCVTAPICLRVFILPCLTESDSST